MKELLFSDAMIDALASIIIWLFVFIVVHFICRLNRLERDIIKNAVEDTRKMKKIVKFLANAIDKGGIDKKSVRKGFWKFRATIKNTRSIIMVYNYENGMDGDLKLVEKLLTDILEETNIFAKVYNTSTKSEVLKVLELVRTNLDKTDDILSSVLKRREDKYLYKI